jgi:hypothetical protein
MKASNGLAFEVSASGNGVFTKIDRLLKKL